MSYVGIIQTMVLAGSLCFGNFFSNSTFYGSATMSTPYINNALDLNDDYKYTFGLRKIALFPYQERDRFYNGTEEELTDKAIIGAVDGIEYLFSYSSVRNQGHKYDDGELWLKWSNNWFVTKTKYVNKGSRDLEFFDFDTRFRLKLNKIDFTVGGTVRAHPIYGHFAYDDYVDPWWFLAYDYGYSDYLVPTFDLNDNGEIDSYYIWIEIDEYTEEGYWVYFTESSSYYWEDPNGDAVAYSDAEFHQYHLPNIIDQYNEDNKIKDWQSELSLVIGLDILLGGDKFYTHTWVNLFPKSFGLTDKAYEGDEMQYDIGLIIGANLSEHIGVFIEGNKLNYYGRDEYNLNTGVNWRF